MSKLKLYAAIMGVGAAIGITVAEMWRRNVRHDSYLNYLPPPREGESELAVGGRSGGRMRGAANRLWMPVATSAKRDLTRFRRIRVGAPRPNAGAPAPAEAQPDAVPPVSAT
jgi:hypothetical protein